MTELFFWIGVFSTGLVALCFIVAFCVCVREIVNYRLSISEDKVMERLTNSIRLRQAGEAWWFSEDEDTLLLLQDLATGMSVAVARDRWRARRRKKAAVATREV